MDLVDYTGEVFPPPSSADATDSILFSMNSMHGRELSPESSWERESLVILNSAL